MIADIQGFQGHRLKIENDVFSSFVPTGKTMRVLYS